jgi:hypothetical protein
MDRQSIARLANASKTPLGAVGEILEQQFTEEQRATRRAEADTATATMVETPEEMQAGPYFPPMTLGMCQRICDIRQRDYPSAIAKLLAPPGRCTEHGCRGVPHRFATYVACPLHHK